MGGRGSFDHNMGKTGGIPHEKREYSQIGKIGKIKIIQCNTKSNNPAPTYSNTANTTYFAYSKEHQRIEHIYYYKKHKLVKSVDFDSDVAPHSHYWNSGMVGRKRHDKHNTHELSDRDVRLMNQAIKWNSDHGQKGTN